ncbi:Acyl-CoA dehydrogenase family member 11 [Araneus ventricosus]|uniref:Acyl-CoA dehydrogenase family member 11 n=1 Tax=Araneus ventricosus TaxID=182803 RepID=A0A4Y2AR66_ARAVE|nr:Acyl-CoA dehydrogenase family member 11 [Araneus ventricosus]
MTAPRKANPSTTSHCDLRPPPSPISSLNYSHPNPPPHTLAPIPVGANGTETVAVPDNGFYRLYGYKWFSSASDANIALTLARIVQNPEMSKAENGLTMFCVETRNSQGQLNNIQMVKLKNKLGTRGLPTAELLLDGCVAYKMSQEGRGIASISHMLNTTRVHNSLTSVGYMRKILLLSRDYSRKRVAFGKTLSEIPLHMRVLSNIEVEIRASSIPNIIKVKTKQTTVSDVSAAKPKAGFAPNPAP